MGFFSALGFGKRQPRAASQAVSPSDDLTVAILSGLSTLSGTTVTELSALGVPTVFSCVSKLSRSISTLPLYLYRKTDKGRERATDHPLYDVLRYVPNAEMSADNFIGALTFNLTLRNQAFAFVTRNNAGEVSQLVPILPTDIVRRRDGGSSGKELRYYVKGIPYKPEHILDVRATTHNGINGLDVLGTAGECIGLARALQDNAAKFFANGQRISDVLSTEGNLSKEAIERLRNQLADRKKRGDDYSSLILEEGLKYVTYRSENKDSQFQEAREHQDKKIAALFGIPPHKVGIMSDATFSNIEHQNIEWLVDCLRPYLRYIENAINFRLLTKEERSAGYYCEFLTAELLSADIKSRYEAYNIARMGGWMSVNDILESENKNKIEGGDIYLTPLNMADSKAASTEEKK